MVAGYRMNEDPVVGLGVEDLEGEFSDETTTRRASRGLAVKGECGGKSGGGFDFRAKACAEALAKGFANRRSERATRRVPLA